MEENNGRSRSGSETKLMGDGQGGGIGDKRTQGDGKEKGRRHQKRRGGRGTQVLA